jgi:hypothetical protein
MTQPPDSFVSTRSSALVRMMFVAIALLPAGASCTRANPAFCCSSPDDCTQAGISDDKRDCADGLACVDHSCVVPSCATAGCDSAAPVCDLAADVCAGCTDSAECARFLTSSVCDSASGACVGCVGDTDCGAAEPVCANQTCRACALDSECPSGACADDGTCVPEASVVYLAPQGTDAVPCSRTQPCKGLGFAVRQTNNARNHIVYAPGNYNEFISGTSSSGTTAASLHIHEIGRAHV